MKNILNTLVLISAFSLFTSGVFAQFDVSGIENKTMIIKNNLEMFTKSESDISKDSIVIGHREVYMMGKEVALAIILGMDQEGNESRFEYYYSNNNLIYIERKTTKAQGVLVEKFYFDNGHLQSWINPENKSVDQASEDFKATDGLLSTNAIKIKKEFEN